MASNSDDFNRTVNIVVSLPFYSFLSHFFFLMVFYFGFIETLFIEGAKEFSKIFFRVWLQVIFIASLPLNVSVVFFSFCDSC